MRSVHPAFDVSTRTWFTLEAGLQAEAVSLALLQAKLGSDVIITGYVPLGAPAPVRHAPVEQLRPLQVLVPAKVQPARPPSPPPRPAPSGAARARVPVKPPAPTQRAAPARPPAEGLCPPPLPAPAPGCARCADLTDKELEAGREKRDATRAYMRRYMRNRRASGAMAQ